MMLMSEEVPGNLNAAQEICNDLHSLRSQLDDDLNQRGNSQQSTQNCYLRGKLRDWSLDAGV